MPDDQRRGNHARGLLDQRRHRVHRDQARHRDHLRPDKVFVDCRAIGGVGSIPRRGPQPIDKRRLQAILPGTRQIDCPRGMAQDLDGLRPREVQQLAILSLMESLFSQLRPELLPLVEPVMPANLIKIGGELAGRA